MKGIRRLFLGLFLLTLFSVGFGIEAKAEITATVTKTDGGGIKYSIEVGEDGFPPAGETVKHTLKLIGASDLVIDTITRTVEGENKHFVNFNDGEGEKEMSDSPFSKDVTVDAGTVKGLIDAAQEEDKKKSVKFEVKDGDTSLGDVTVTAYKVELKAEGGPDDVAFAPEELFLLPGAEESVKVTSDFIPGTADADGEDAVYKYLDWALEGNVSLLDKASGSVKVKMNDDATAAATVTITYKSCTLRFDPQITPGTVSVKSTGSVSERMVKTRKVYSDYTYDDIANQNSVVVNGEPAEKVVWAATDFGFTISEGTPPDDNAEVKIYMKDGNSFRCYLKVTGDTPTTEHKITMLADPTKGGEAKAMIDGETVTSAEEGKGVVISATAEEDYEFEKWTVDAGGVEIDKLTKDAASFTMLDEDVQITAHFKYTGEDPEVEVDEPIKVTKDRSIKLSNFVDDISAVETVEGDGVYVKAETSGDDFLIKGVKITSNKEVEAIMINGKDYDVIVYDLPTITKSTSKDSILEVKMPTNVWHNSDKLYDWDGIRKTKVGFFESGSSSGRGADYELSTKSEYGYAKLDWYEVSKRAKEITSSDEPEITVVSYPVKSGGSEYDKYVTDDEELEVYRIRLYTSGGAKYKVNDKELDDDDPWFYAVDGVEYKIEASARNGGSLKYWEVDGSRVDSTSETRTFTADEATTFKAVYNSSSSSSSSSSSYSYYSSSSTGRTTAIGAGGTGSGGDYDDVPRTGESKTDIWILWSVLLASILGAGFMIYKRFGLVRAIAEADKEVAEAAKKESVMKQEKEKENILKTLKGLRKL